MGGTCQFQAARPLLHTRYCHGGETGSMAVSSEVFVASCKYNYSKIESLKKVKSVLTTMTLNKIQMGHRTKYSKSDTKDYI